MKLNLEIDRQGAFFFILNALLGGYNRRTDAISGGLHAIALALSTPHNNSTEVQAKIDAATATLKGETDKVKDAVDDAQQ